MRRGDRGISTFSLIETIMVVAIIFILWHIAVPPYRQYVNRSKAQNAAAQVARDIEWARSLALKYEDNVYVALEDENNNFSPQHIKIYKSTGVAGEGNFGTRSDPFLLRNLERDFGNVYIDFVGLATDTLTLGPGGYLYEGPNYMNPVTVQLTCPSTTSSSDIIFNFTVNTSGHVVFEKGKGI